MTLIDLDCIDFYHLTGPELVSALEEAPIVTPEQTKYEYHIDHTDCIWHGTGDNQCPVTCSQYRDGWNDAMNYIFKDGKGYQPYKRR